MLIVLLTTWATTSASASDRPAARSHPMYITGSVSGLAIVGAPTPSGLFGIQVGYRPETWLELECGTGLSISGVHAVTTGRAVHAFHRRWSLGIESGLAAALRRMGNLERRKDLDIDPDKLGYILWAHGSGVATLTLGRAVLRIKLGVLVTAAENESGLCRGIDLDDGKSGCHAPHILTSSELAAKRALPFYEVSGGVNLF